MLGEMRRRWRLLASFAAVIAAALAAVPGASADVEKHRISYSGPESSAGEIFFERGGMRLTGACAAGLEATITLTSLVDDATVHVNGQGPGGGGAVEDNDMDEGDALDLLAALGLDAQFDSGQIIFSRPNGVHTTIDWGAIENATGVSAEHRCEFFGAAALAARGRDPKTRKRIDFRAGEGERKAVLKSGGLRLRARCLASGGLRVSAGTGVDHAVLHVNGQGGVAAPYAGVDNLRDNERLNLLARLGGIDQAGVGQLIYASPRGTVVSVDWLAEDVDPYGGRRDCAFVGTARVLGKRSRERAFFARNRTRPLLIPRTHARGVPFPDFKPFLTRGPFSLHGACTTKDPKLHPHNLDGRVTVDERGGLAGNEQSAVGLQIVGSVGTTSAGSFLFYAPTRNSGHVAMFTRAGAVMTADWLAQEGAFGQGSSRRRCLLAGTTEFFRAP